MLLAQLHSSYGKSDGHLYDKDHFGHNLSLSTAKATLLKIRLLKEEKQKKKAFCHSPTRISPLYRFLFLLSQLRSKHK